MELRTHVRLSLRTALFAFLVVFVCVIAVFLLALHRYYHAIHVIESLGGTVGVDEYWLVFNLRARASSLTDANIPTIRAALIPLYRLQSLNLSGTSLTDNGIARVIEGLPIATLHLDNMDVSTQTIDALQRLNLCVLTLRSSRIHVSLLELRRLNHLEYLDVSGSTATDSEVDTLRANLPTNVNIIY